MIILKESRYGDALTSYVKNYKQSGISVDQFLRNGTIDDISFSGSNSVECRVRLPSDSPKGFTFDIRYRWDSRKKTDHFVLQGSTTKRDLALIAQYISIMVEDYVIENGFLPPKELVILFLKQPLK